MRELIPINFNWFCAPYEDSHLKNRDKENFQKVNLPHHGIEIPFHHFNEKILESELSYLYDLDAKKSWEGKIVKILFEGVAHQAKIYINRNYVGDHRGGYTAFEFDISEKLIYGEKNEVWVIVDSKEDPSIPPFGGVVDFLGYSGIYREVSLLVLEQQHIKYTFIKNNGNSKVQFEIGLSQNNGEIDVSILKANKKIVSMKSSKVMDQTINIDLDIERPVLWDLKTHYLYDAIITYRVNDEVIDQITERFGIRSAEFKEDGFYLNGEKIKLLGLNRHQSYPYVGYAMPKSAQYEDAEILKYQLGTNIVRTSHYPQSKHFLDRCDEIGLLVFEEIPGWQHIGDEKWQDLSCQNVKEMILRDRNHPSIVLWGVRINESADNHDFYFKTNGIARNLDPTRQTAGVRNLQQSEFLEDVYTYNDFSHRGYNRGLEEKSKITKKIPYLVSEYNGHMFPTKRYDDELHRLSHALRHLNVIHEMMEKDNHISGSIGWCMSDYNTHQEFGSGDRICYHGVLDMFRIPKMASFSYASQNQHQPILEVSSTMNIGDHPAGELSKVYVFTNMDYIKLFKNDQYVGTFYPDKKQYPNLEHPPVIITDFIGDTLKENEKMSHRDAEMTKGILKTVGQYGNHLPLKFKLKILYLLKKYKMSYDEGVKMFYRYMSGWGTEKMSYRFEGYQNNQLMKTVFKENNETFEYVLDVIKKELKIEDTYDVSRCVISKVNQHQELVQYSFDPITIKVSGAVELIGPNQVSLQGGTLGFWVKTKSKGKGKIEIHVNEQTISKEVVVL
ncbi:MAG: glycoside hydrolase family 2 protein [Acholeplasmataceae bacterium]|nr:glycoside hydrolase family 2 protein [Acholeplasmataceae bacterium]